jgi:hypothetical protein
VVPARGKAEDPEGHAKREGAPGALDRAKEAFLSVAVRDTPSAERHSEHPGEDDEETQDREKFRVALAERDNLPPQSVLGRRCNVEGDDVPSGQP